MLLLLPILLRPQAVDFLALNTMCWKTRHMCDPVHRHCHCHHGKNWVFCSTKITNQINIKTIKDDAVTIPTTMCEFLLHQMGILIVSFYRVFRILSDRQSLSKSSDTYPRRQYPFSYKYSESKFISTHYKSNENPSAGQQRYQGSFPLGTHATTTAWKVCAYIKTEHHPSPYQ